MQPYQHKNKSFETCCTKSFAHLRCRRCLETLQNDVCHPLAGQHIAANDGCLGAGPEDAVLWDLDLHRPQAALWQLRYLTGQKLKAPVAAVAT